MITDTKRYAEFDGVPRRILYNHGLPITRGIYDNIISLKERIRLRKASLLIIDGGVGEGKTTLAVQLADVYQGKPINFKFQLAYGGEEFQEKLVMCIDNKLPVIIYDEAGDFSRRGSLTTFNQQLNRVFETYRTYGILVIIVLPTFRVLDSQLFENKIPRLMLHCYGRNENHGRVTGYSLRRMFWLMHHFSKTIVRPEAYKRVTPNFRGNFLNLPPARTQELHQFSTKHKREVLTENIVANRGMKTIKQIAQEFGVQYSTVRVKIARLKMKEDFKKGTTRYYCAEKIARLKRS